MILGVSWFGVVSNTDHKQRLINSCAGDARLLMVVFQYSSKLRYRSDLVSLALISSLLIISVHTFLLGHLLGGGMDLLIHEKIPIGC